MSIQQHVLLRYRSEGHVRFSLPAPLCTPETALRLESELLVMEGIYRVDVFPRQGKLSIRYLDSVCDFSAVIRRLHAVIAGLADLTIQTIRAASQGRKAGSNQTRQAGLHSARPPAVVAPFKQWARARLEAAEETVRAAGIVIGAGFHALEQRPRWVTEFLNDLVMLYLIKLHWHHIITLWLPNPWRYRYEWLATFYLIHLSVRSRLPKPS